MFTVCDKAAGGVCPVWPGQPMTAHWGVPDPAAIQGTDEEKAKAFRDSAVILKRRLELMLALPPASLNQLGIQREIRDIGSRCAKADVSVSGPCLMSVKARGRSKPTFPLSCDYQIYLEAWRVDPAAWVELLIRAAT